MPVGGALGQRRQVGMGIPSYKWSQLTEALETGGGDDAPIIRA